jgi:phosphocarrier protein HPr
MLEQAAFYERQVTMAERQATIASSSGLHARPAKLFVQAVQEKKIPVTIAVEGGPDLNAGSILSLMGLGAANGTVVTLKAEGEGSEQALDELVALLETDLDAVE